MTDRMKSWLMLAWGTLAAGAIYWPPSYTELNNTDRGFLLQWALAGLVAGGIAQRFLRLRPSRTTALITLGFVAAVMLRVVVETWADPTDHNLWPFEVVIGAVVGLVGGGIGAQCGRLITPTSTSG